MFPNSLPLQNKCDVLDYHPKGIWAINKSTGVLSHPNNKEEQKKSLLKCSYDFEQECYRWTDPSGISQAFFLVHRLDSATSGVLLATSSQNLALELKNAFAQRLIHKTYHAIVEFSGRDISSIWKDTLIKKTSQGKIRVVQSKTGQPAVTQVSIERRKRSSQYSLALLKLVPTTGRTHQLRVQSAIRKVPIIGDRTYGNFSLNRKIAKLSKENRLFLHSSEISLDIKTKQGDKITWHAESPLPRSFGRLMS
jgi:tRNA pseudouridine65 synthase